jgi:UDP-glucose 4-epimerase
MTTPSGLRVLVTGGSGFLGRHLVAALAADNTVFSLQRRTVPPNARAPGVEYVYHDLVGLAASELPTGIDLVIHQAALIDDPGGPNDPRPMELLRANVAATLQLLMVARELGIPRFVHGSSGSVYGASATPHSEESPLRPSNMYGLSKCLAEEIVKWHGAHFRSVVVLRYGTPVGRWCSNALLLGFLRKISDGAPIDLGADHDTLFNPIPVADLVRLTLLAAGLDGTHMFNVGGLETMSFSAMAQRIAATLGRDALPTGGGAGTVRSLHRMMNSERIRATFNYAGDRPVAEAVDELVRWWVDDGTGLASTGRGCFAREKFAAARDIYRRYHAGERWEGRVDVVQNRGYRTG